MDETNRDRTDQRREAVPQPGNDSPATEARATDNTATVCAWCPEIHILKLGPERQAADVLIIYQQGRKAKIILNGRDLVILEAICQNCRDRELSKGKTQP